SPGLLNERVSRIRLKSSWPPQTLSRFRKSSSPLAKSKAGPRLPFASKFDRASKGLSDRRTQVLYAVVTEYIRTGLPSGSRTLAETYGLDLSPATIRHVLKELEEEDFLTQPHTSAGRLPTERALRLYVDALMRVENVSPETAERIRAFFQAHRGAALEA